MSYWNLLIIAGGVIVFSILLYLPLRWRKARRAFNAIRVVAITSFAAGVLIGIWSLHIFGVWMGTGGGDERSGPDRGTGASAAISTTLAPAAEVTPPSASAATTTETNPLGPILASYVGQALAQKRGPGRPAGWMETWSDVDQGCRLGNYEKSAALCRAAVLVVHGWGDTTPVPLYEVLQFCDEGYLDKGLALCLVAASSADGSGHTARGSIPSTDDSRVASSEVSPAIHGAESGYGITGPDGRSVEWDQTIANCGRRRYAPSSPACEAAAIVKHSLASSKTVPYWRVARFCDVGAMNRDTELCRAAYRVVTSESGSTR